MSVVKAILLGIVQGLTEFLPVSSSGHLVLAKSLMRVKTSGVVWEVVLHAATLAAVVVVLRREVWGLIRGFFLGVGQGVRTGRPAAVWRRDVYFRLSLLILLGSVPAAVVGILFESTIERLFANPLLVGFALLVTGALVWLTKRVKPRAAPEAGSDNAGNSRAETMAGPRHTRIGHALLIGAAQAGAIVPGISRSGATIAAGLFCGLPREFAVRFSFLLALPAIGGALLLKMDEVAALGRSELGPLAAGGAAAMLTGAAALWLIIRLVVRGRLHWFAPYCWAVGVAVIVLGLAA